jgi:PRTRC genetic system ThiF family protein
MNLFWGFDWKAIPAHFTRSSGVDAGLVIGCVDSRAARAEIACACSASGACRYVLDLGNGASFGQYLLGEPARWGAAARPDRLPTAAEVWPELIDTAAPATDDGPSCSAAEAITRQEPFINQVLANHALSLLGRLFAGGIDHHGGYVNLATGRCSPIPVPPPRDPDPPAKKNGGAASRRARRRRAAAPAGGV